MISPASSAWLSRSWQLARLWHGVTTSEEIIRKLSELAWIVKYSPLRLIIILFHFFSEHSDKLTKTNWIFGRKMEGNSFWKVFFSLLIYIFLQFLVLSEDWIIYNSSPVLRDGPVGLNIMEEIRQTDWSPALILEYSSCQTSEFSLVTAWRILAGQYQYLGFWDSSFLLSFIFILPLGPSLIATSCSWCYDGTVTVTVA